MEEKRFSKRVPYICTLEKRPPSVPPQFRVCLAGPCGSGKTSLLNRWRGFDFLEDLRPTCGANFTTFDQTTPAGRIFVEQVWDTAGQEAYASLLPIYLRKASVVVAVFDIRSFSLEVFDRFLGSLESCPESCRLALVLNKADLVDSCEPALAEARRVGFIPKTRLRFDLLGTFATSCRTGCCCQEVLESITANLAEEADRAKETIATRTGNATDTETQTGPPKESCC